ncbi:MAG: hydantoinase/oxoprolinase family protein [Methylophilaceae bacterium]
MITGWDIGGAHLKAVRLDKVCCKVLQLACPLWKGLQHLEQAVAEALILLGDTNQHAITMTGELADIFPNRHQGVMQISQAMQKLLAGKNLKFYGSSGFIAPQEVEANTHKIASANWLASAQFVADKCKDGVFVDVGSTTTDVVELKNGQPKPQGFSDAERLTSDTLIYTGVVRTPVMAVVQRLPFNGQMQRVAAEHFATMADVYRLTGKLAAKYDLAETADGQGKSQLESARRLARMLGRDVETVPMLAWQALAHFIANTQLQDLLAVVKAQAPKTLIGAGVGRFLVREMAQRLKIAYVDFADLVEGDSADVAAVCAPAYAVAALL